VWKCTLMERVCLPPAGPAAGDPREVVSPSEYRAGVTGSSTAAAQQTFRHTSPHQFQAGCYLSKCTLLGRVRLPAAGPAAGDPRAVVSPSEH
jgi:hypothetical protein